MSNTLKRVAILVLVVCLPGCGGLRHRIYNYMCGAPHGYGYCARPCCQPHAPTPAAAGMPGSAMPGSEMAGPALQEVSGGPQFAAIQEQIGQLVADNEDIHDKLATLDTLSEQQRQQSAEVASVMKKVSESLGVVSDELHDKRTQFADLEARVLEQRDRSNQVLTDVERELNDVLSKIDN